MTSKNDWGIVEDIFMEGDKCEGCEYRTLVYYDMGQYSCSLLDAAYGKPTDCPQLEGELELRKEEEANK
jgi:hypothetical protein